MSDTITYEQPLNEQIRLCLRLEHLFKILHDHMHQHTRSDSQTALTALVRVLNVIERPDLKSKLAQTLAQQVQGLSQYQTQTNVDQQKLVGLIQKLNQLILNLHRMPGKIAENIRHNPFLKQIRLQSNNPTGPCYFTAPAYALWLHQPAEQRSDDLANWAKEFSELNTVVSTILNLTRDSAPTLQVVSQTGSFEQTLNPALPCQLVRVTLPIEYNAYPEISVGRHRLAIRFRPLDQLNQGQQLPQQAISFSLSCCQI